MKNKKINGKQIKLIINIISLGIFIFSYFYLYENYVDKTEKTYLDAENLKTEIKIREQKLTEEDAVREQIAEVEAEKQKIIDSYPVYIGDEDNFMFIEQMEKVLNVKTSSISTSDNSIFFETILPAIGDDEVAAVNSDENGITEETNTSSDHTQTQKDSSNTAKEQPMMTATVNSVSMSFITDYKGLKAMAEYINKYPDHTIIESIAVSADNLTGVLAGNLVLKRFALAGSGKEYQAPSIEGIDIGTDNIFGSGTNADENQQAGQE